MTRSTAGAGTIAMQDTRLPALAAVHATARAPATRLAVQVSEFGQEGMDERDPVAVSLMS